MNRPVVRMMTPAMREALTAAGVPVASDDACVAVEVQACGCCTTVSTMTRSAAEKKVAAGAWQWPTPACATSSRVN